MKVSECFFPTSPGKERSSYFFIESEPSLSDMITECNMYFCNFLPKQTKENETQKKQKLECISAR